MRKTASVYRKWTRELQVIRTILQCFSLLPYPLKCLIYIFFFSVKSWAYSGKHIQWFRETVKLDSSLKPEEKILLQTHKYTVDWQRDMVQIKQGFATARVGTVSTCCWKAKVDLLLNCYWSLQVLVTGLVSEMRKIVKCLKQVNVGAVRW